MNGPRGTLVIGLLFLIAGQLAFIASALTGGRGYSLFGGLLCLFFVVALVRVVVELFREGAESAPKPAKKRRSAAAGPGTPTAMRDPDARASMLDPEKQRPAQF